MGVIKQSDTPIALVTDEFGTVQGLITPIDILEAIAGEFPDEGEQNPIEQLADGCWMIDGSAELHEVEERLGLQASLEEHSEHASLSALLLTHFGKLPDVGESMALNGFRFEVAQIAGRSIRSVKAVRQDKRDEERSEPGLN
jgi:CBS domain containing-hemolysin-like protein